MLYGVFILVMVIVILFLQSEGLWGAALTLIITIFSALVAMNYFENLAGVLDGLYATGTYHYDAISLLLIFAFMVIALKQITKMISKYQVMFPSKVELFGKYIACAMTGWIFFSFLLVAMQAAPLGREFMGYNPDSKNNIVVGPDVIWLAFTHNVSKKTLSSFTGQAGERVFDKDVDFRLRYSGRRKEFENAP